MSEKKVKAHVILNFRKDVIKENTGLWYICSGIFGDSPNHQYLAHPARGWLTIGEGLEPFSVMIMLWLVQAIVLWAIAFLCFVIRKMKNKEKVENGNDKQIVE